MKWRTDKPTADVIVAKLKDYKKPHVLTSFLRGYYQDENLNEIELKEIEKWADLEEDETVTDCDELKDEMSRFITRYFSVPDYEEDFIAEVDWENSMRECARHFAKWGAEHLKNKQK